MYPRTEYEMNEEQLAQILDASKPVPVMMIGNYAPSSPQANANAAWAKLGTEMGFDSDTVRPISGRGQRFFTAVPSETAQQRQERLEQEAAAKLAAKMSVLATQFVDDLPFDVLIEWANILGVEHDEKQWLDDEWPEKDSEQRAKVAEAMEKVGKKAQAERDRRNKR